MSNKIRCTGSGNVISGNVQMSSNGVSQCVDIGNGYAVINGKRYTYPKSASVSVVNGNLFVNGRPWTSADAEASKNDDLCGTTAIKIVIDADGKISIESSDNIVVHGNVTGNVITTGDATINGDVHRSVKAKGDVKVSGNIGGDVDARGDVTCKSISGQKIDW